MADLGWLIIRNWDRYQARRDERDWHYVRNQVGLLSDDDYLALPEKTALLWHRLLIAFALSRGCLRIDTRLLSNRLGQHVMVKQLELLEQAGFIAFSAAKPPRLGSGSAPPAGVEKRREELTQSDRSSPTVNEDPARPPDTGPDLTDTSQNGTTEINLDRYWQERQRTIAAEGPGLEPIAASIPTELESRKP